MGTRYDAVVVGAGPNGLAAAILLAQHGCRVLVIERAPTIGGGARSMPLTLPGFVHDICSAIQPLGMASPFLRTLPLDQYGLEWIDPPAALAHPLDDGTAAVLERSIDATAATLGVDSAAYRRLITPVVRDWYKMEWALLGPFPIPRHPIAMARFGLRALLPSTVLAKALFRGDHARALLTGVAAHAIVPLEQPLVTAGIGLLLSALGHLVGWPIPRGGSQQIADALGAYFRSLGGEIVTGTPIKSIKQLPPARAVLFDLTPRQIMKIMGRYLPATYRARLQRYRYGAGAFKVDWAIDGPIPWTALECARAGTVHLGGTLDEIAAGERMVARGEHPQRPFVLLAQQSLFDDTRAPAGKHTVWAYCHVPHGSSWNMTERIEAQIERFAPGFQDRIVARHVLDPQAMERHNPNYIGGDINGGIQDIWQFWTRPVLSRNPYRIPADNAYICSSSTPPGGGVHGMCGYWAARAALKHTFGMKTRDLGAREQEVEEQRLETMIS